MRILAQVSLLEQLLSLQLLQLVVVLLALLGLHALLPLGCLRLVLLGLQMLHTLEGVCALLGQILLTLIEDLLQFVLLALLLVGS